MLRSFGRLWFRGKRISHISVFLKQKYAKKTCTYLNMATFNFFIGNILISIKFVYVILGVKTQKFYTILLLNAFSIKQMQKPDIRSSF